MLNFSRVVPAPGAILLGFVALVAAPSCARAQNEFTMQLEAPFSPSSVLPGESAVATVSLSPSPGFSGTVSLSCAVTPVEATSPPTCTASPTPVTPPASPSVTLATSSATPSGSYMATVTGVGGGMTHDLSLTFAVLTVTPGYTITVTGPVTPSSVHAGSGATAILSVTPANGYTGSVTLSCSAIAPTATPAPSCSFAPNPVVISGPAAQTSTLTITTSATKAALPRSGIFYAVWLPLPAFALMAAGVGSGPRHRRLLNLTLLCAMAWGLLLLPACGSNSSSSTTSSGGTPKNTYTFTLNGSDANAMAPSNGTQTVTLTVN